MPRKKLRDDGIPTRQDMRMMTPAELAIVDAGIAIEKLGCDERLTRAVALLVDARNLVADFVESTE